MLKRSLTMCVACVPLLLVFGCPTLPATCSSDTDCTGSNGVCSNGTCVECATDADCSSGQVCSASNTCVDCNTDADCATDEVCTSGTCGAASGGVDPVAGESFYTANGCIACHAADGSGGVGPNIQDETSAEIFARLSGAASHPVTVSGVTTEDTDNVAAWLNSL